MNEKEFEEAIKLLHELHPAPCELLTTVTGGCTCEIKEIP